jgi:PAS domain S-box-containing protein
MVKREREEEIQARLAAQHAVASGLLEADTLAQAAKAILPAIAQTLGWNLALLWDAVPGTDALNFVDCWEACPGEAQTFWQRSRDVTMSRGLGLPGRAWELGEVAFSAELATDPSFPRMQAAAQANLVGSLAVPAPVGDPKAVVAVMEFFTTKEMVAPDKEVQELLVGFAAQLAGFVVRRRAEQAVRERDALHSAILASSLDCVITIDHQGTVVEFNPAAQETFGYQREEAVGKEMATLIIPPSLRKRHRQALESFKEGREQSILDRRIELVGMHRDGTEFPIELTVTQIRGHQPPMFTGYIRDVTEHKLAAEAKDFLASASALFDSSLDPVQTMRTIAQAAVPKLAELCVIDLLRDDGAIGDSVVAAVDSGTVRKLEELRARQPLDPTGLHPVARALRLGEPVVVHDLTDSDVLDEVAQSDEHRQFMQEAGYRSAVVISLIAEGRLLGALSFLRVQNDYRAGPSDLALMQDLASRAAMALNNANLYSERTRVARTLQRSLLPEALPTVQGVQLASAYHPVGEGNEVGGDFYDVFEVPSGSWLVVGDVCGKGPAAAAITALVRHSIRALAFNQDSPTQVLRSVNEVMLTHELGARFATAILARLDLTGTEAKAHIASAGHPPPLVVEANGHATAPEVTGTLLGVLPNMNMTELSLPLAAGSTLIFYTDGLLDAGAPARELSPSGLAQYLSQATGLPGELVARLEELALATSAGNRRDDIAILAARIQPQA